MTVYYVHYQTGTNFNESHSDGPFYDRPNAEQSAIAHAGQGHLQIVIREEDDEC